MKRLLARPWFYNSAPVLIWFLLLILPFLSRPGNIPPEMHRRFITEVVTSNFILLCIFYVHTFFIYPMLNRKGVVWYVVSLLVVLGLYFTYWLLFSPPHYPGGGGFGKNMQASGVQPKPGDAKFTPQPGFGSYIRPIISVLTALMCSFCYRVVLDNSLRQQMMKERETIHLKTELNFLRSQISPHFMFNILNNLVSLARKKSDDLEPAIINLSHLMRYMLYESDDNKVPLAKEVEYIKSYIQLQMLRFGNEVKVHINISGNCDMYTIEPMLLIPFVENAFKHGTGMISDPVILISLNVNEEKKMLEFRVVNSVSPLDTVKDKNSGIGLSNVQRRLAILYPELHKLSVSSQNNSFTTELSLDLGNR